MSETEIQPYSPEPYAPPAPEQPAVSGQPHAEAEDHDVTFVKALQSSGLLSEQDAKEIEARAAVNPKVLSNVTVVLPPKIAEHLKDALSSAGEALKEPIKKIISKEILEIVKTPTAIVAPEKEDHDIQALDLVIARLRSIPPSQKDTTRLVDKLVKVENELKEKKAQDTELARIAEQKAKEQQEVENSPENQKKEESQAQENMAAAKAIVTEVIAFAVATKTTFLTMAGNVIDNVTGALGLNDDRDKKSDIKTAQASPVSENAVYPPTAEILALAAEAAQLSGIRGLQSTHVSSEALMTFAAIAPQGQNRAPQQSQSTGRMPGLNPVA